MAAQTAQPSRTFRVFVSSTFEDLKAERDALQRYVFPRLADLCATRNARFQAIDLRWGVSEEASLDQRAIPICLTEIERCQRLTPRPNFIVLLGDRYGWRPLPASIGGGEFDAILAKVPPDSEDAAFLAQTRGQNAGAEGWYVPDGNADPPEYVLRPREVIVPDGATGEERKAAQDAEYEEWKATEARLRAILLRAIGELGWREDDPAMVKYLASAIEQEIVRGALEADGAAGQVFGFFRSINGLPADETAKGFCDLAQSPGGLVTDGDAKARLGALKAKLTALLGDHVLPAYQAAWTGTGITTGHVGDLPGTLEDCLALLNRPDAPHTLCADVWRSLAGVIISQLNQPETMEALDREITSHVEFGQARRTDFVGRGAMREQIARYLAGSEPRPLALIGEGGSGKSALMAQVLAEADGAHPGAVRVVRFIGATSASSDGRSLLSSLCHQLARAYGDQTAIPADYNDLPAKFGKQIGQATRERPLIVFLDALDQLGPADPARGLSWLPAQLPDHVRLVVSTLPGDCESALRGKHPQPRLLSLDKLTRQEGQTALGLWLAKAGRRLQDSQQQEVLGKFEPEGRPLFLKLAFEEARLWHSFTDPAQATLHAGIGGLISGNLFTRLGAPQNHGRTLVAHALGYLAASRYGLAEDELVAVLSADGEVMADFHDRSPRSPDVTQLPVVIWSRLYFDLEPYLSEHAADGATLLSFYHRVLGEAAAEEYLADRSGPGRHSALADYFKAQADPARDRTWAGGSVRGLSELPFHLASAGRLDDLSATLTDFSFLEHKAAEVHAVTHPGADGAPASYNGIFELQNDYAIALATFGSAPASGRRPIIITGTNFGAGLAVRCPWCDQDSPLDHHWRGQDIQCPHCRGPLHVNTFLVGEVAPQAAAAMTVQTTPSTETDDRQTTLKAFARALRRELYTLAKWPELTWQQLYNRLQWESNAVTERLADVRRRRSRPGGRPWMHRYSRLRESEALVRILTGHTAFVVGCAVSPDGSWIVSASEDHTLKIWDSATGAERTTLTGHTALVNGCAVSHDGAIVVSAGGDSTLKIWDAATGTEQVTLIGHSNQVNACALSPDDTWIVSASDDRTLKIWDIATESERATLRGHTDLVRGCAISPDGTWIVSAGNDRTLRIWDAATGALRTTLIGHADEVRGCAVSPDGAWIVSASRDRTLKIWDVASGAARATLDGHTDQAHGCAVSPDGTWIVSASRDHSLKIWDTATGAELSTLTGHTGYVVGCAVSPDGAWIVSAATDHALNIWDTAIDGQPNAATGHKSAVYGCAVSPDGSWIVSSSWDRTLKIWDAASGAERRTLTGHVGVVRRCAVSPDGTWIVSASHDRTLSIWDAATGAERAALTGHTDSVSGCAISPDGAWIVSASKDGTLKIWDAAGGAERAALIGHSDGVSRFCAVSPDGRWIVSAGADLKIWDAATGAERITLTGHSGLVTGCAVSPDGTWVVSASYDRTLRIWDIQTGVERITLAGHDDRVDDCAVSPDGAWIASAGWDHTIRIWDAATGAERAVLVLPGAAYAVAFHPFAPMVACGDRGGNVHLVHLVGIDLGPLVATAAIRRHDLTVRCPACRGVFSIGRDSIGSETECPVSVCATRLRVNPFVFQPLPSHAGLRRWFGGR